jgi:hypothetical protein
MEEKMKNVGDKVLLNGKTFTIAGFYKRSYLLTDERGKQYKCGPEKLDRIEAGKPPVHREARTILPDLTYFVREIHMNKIFGRIVEMPNKQNAKFWMEKIENELSPENLHCDGEITRAQAMVKYRYLMGAMAHVKQIEAGA